MATSKDSPSIMMGVGTSYSSERMSAQQGVFAMATNPVFDIETHLVDIPTEGNSLLNKIVIPKEL